MQELLCLESVAGVFCVAFGIYEKLINALLNFFKDIKKNTLFLLPIAVGTLFGIFLFANVLQILYTKFYMVTSYAFIGLILGSLPLIIKQAEITKVSFAHIMCMIVTFVFSIYLILLENTKLDSLKIISNNGLIVAGIFMSLGVVIPGISKTVILMILGVYSTYLYAISTLNLHVLIPLGIGLAIGCLIFLYILQVLFKYVKSYTYFGIIGFVLGSIFVIFPGFALNIEGILCILMFLLCLFIAFKLPT